MTRVLLIEDDPAVRRGVSLGLRRRGHLVEAVATGEDGVEALHAAPPELVLLDLMLPGISGLEVCRRVRETSQVPIVILSARGDDIDVVVGLEAGADDYVVKPAAVAVIEARMRAVLRRVAPAQPTPEGPARTVHGDLEIDRAALRVTKNGRPLPLAPSELKLLLFLSASPDTTFSRRQLLEEVWEHSYYGDVRLVDACVMRLRARTEDDPRAPRYVQTVRGFGYRFGPL
ncbi:DNA-binding response regulator, OmpR family, contains REC and winged-helix (wHTH) domain [Streptomyces zhaozhouensis]|uniref:DNA-binding response regulator, OmpR family, contains REC and winged-helix (WHTH) domain n=1 Tax=Streptomyces zhaozhouensis TaxID=1300267 RepID=A0A286DU75_9ACTN|nr:response regulator transcription factor [Streptomyces zhaozhouensis]SOD62209.1 DNA-binding response regulator, OmpR family, contains REC and winged-helix (wHTH) domain [Streptomyces zhaozhouensis]